MMKHLFSRQIKRAAALCLSALLCASCLCACGAGDTSDGISLSVCVGEIPGTYDPIYAEEVCAQSVLNHLYENLMRTDVDEAGQTVAAYGAAKSVEIEENADGTVTYTFRLRGGKWSDGVEVRAEDFVYAWQRLADPATQSVYAPLLSTVVGYHEARVSGDMSLMQVSAKNSSTLVVTLNGYYDWFLREVCTSIATMPLRQDVVQRLKQESDRTNELLLSNQPLTRWWSDPVKLVTNGPYTASELTGDALTLTVNEGYGRKVTGPHTLTFRFSGETDAQTLYEQGEVDAAWPMSEAWMAAQQEMDETWQAEPVLETYSVLFNQDQLEDTALRQALSLCIDRTAIAALAGVTGQAAAGLVPPGVPHEEEIHDFRTCGGAIIDVDPEGSADRCAQAAALLQEAGYDHSSTLGTLEYLYVDDGCNAAVAEALCEMWREHLDLDITPVAMTEAELMTALRSGAYTLAGLGITAVCNDAECFLMDWTTGNSKNLLHYSNSAYDTLMSIIASAEEGSARMGCLHDAEELLLEIDCALAPLYTTGTAWCLREDHSGGIRDLRGWFDFHNVHVKPVTVQ